MPLEVIQLNNAEEDLIPAVTKPDGHIMSVHNTKINPIVRRSMEATNT